ncbi:MAG: phosphoribosylformylglycinamidine cyclo-ligase [Planctomycetota bacterium]|jgi:phosphoribosylformylglycinamidine cyclo-ligase|nr:phosphoribosylformylglycinamidine cyclo-ligase [Planctomycetota bacterium]
MVAEKSPLTYKDAGVDIDAVTTALKSVGDMAKATHKDPRVLTGLGSFGALFKADFGDMKEPVLVSSTDGVGTKLMVARRMQRFHTVGADLVNHCIDDILVMGAHPLFFMDYVAAGHFEPGMVESIVSGFANACQEQGVALIGGETAEMPGLYGRGDFDLAGFIVGVVDRADVLGPERVTANDVLIGLPSTGLHTNGYSLAQKILFENAGLSPDDTLPGLEGSVGDALLATHRCYLPELGPLLKDSGLHALAHITGGGFTDNLPRVLPEGVGAVVNRDAWEVPPLFAEMARLGPVDRDEMDRTFNMGVGMILVVERSQADRVLDDLGKRGATPTLVGHLEAAERGVRYEGSREL